MTTARNGTFPHDARSAAALYLGTLQQYKSPLSRGRGSPVFSESVEELALPKSIEGGKLSLAKVIIRRISVSVPARPSSGESRPDMIFVN